MQSMPRGGEPYSLRVLEPDLEADSTGSSLDAHVMDPVRVLRFSRKSRKRAGTSAEGM